MGLADLDPCEGLALYVDGSAWNHDRSGAWAFYIHDAFGNASHGAGRVTDTTNNRMEIQAWIEGLTDIHTAHGACRVIVYSDSEYVGLGAMNRHRKRTRNRDLWQLLDSAVDAHYYIEYVHLKGHSGNHIHNIVDKLANDTRRKKIDNTAP